MPKKNEKDEKDQTTISDAEVGNVSDALEPKSDVESKTEPNEVEAKVASDNVKAAVSEVKVATKPAVKVVAAIIYWPANDAVLACQLPKTDPRFPLAWEFAGGKVEDSDLTLLDALARELREELTFELRGDQVRHLLNTTQTTKDGATFDLSYFLVTLQPGQALKVVPGQFAAIQWVERHEIAGFPFLEADAKAAAEFLSAVPVGE